MKIFNLIKKYPKKRAILPLRLRAIFKNFYLENRDNFFSQLSEKWLHTSINDRWKKNVTLEIGAGTLNHLKYEAKKEYDVIEPKKFLFKKSKYKKLINKTYLDINKCKNYHYDRIISCAVLEHLTNLPDYLYSSSFKIKKKGYQQHSIPCEGYPMWNIAWFVFSGIIFRIKYGYSFKYIQKHEHLNNFDEIVSLINFFYKNVETKFSYPFYNKYLSFYSNIKFSNPNKKNLQKYAKYKKILQKKRKRV
tara:strand:+ start:230 stop:973 length:744 start_codon:yes stop_codon:yes gene_type:complete